MKFSVDVNLKRSAITGWASTLDNKNLDECVVSIYRNELLLSKSTLDIQRDDVKNAGLHPDGKCGFEFSANELGFVEGNIYRVIFEAGSQKKYRHVLYGDKNKIVRNYDIFEIARHDFSILEVRPKDLFKDGEDLLGLKKLLIRLRRGKRAHAWRQNFRGEPYEYMQEDWKDFRSFVEEHISLLLSVLSTRHLWSIVDTFADCSDNGERIAALAVSNIMYQERFAQTYKCVYEFIEKEHKISDRQLDYWGGMKTNRLAGDDSYDLFVTRNLECLENFPLMRKFFIYFLKEMARNDSSVLGFNIAHSPFFENMASFYKTNIT